MNETYWIAITKVFGALALLVYGMKTMSDALQKMAGPKLRHSLRAMTRNRLTGVLTGLGVTVAVQSSAATTVMTVSFVNAGLLSLTQAISVIMGANIGTTLTAWIMSAGTTFSMSNIVWPMFVVAIYCLYSRRQESLSYFLFGAGLIFFSLGTLSATGKEMDLAHNDALIQFFGSFDTGSYWTLLLFLGIGTVLTCMVQSSAALMALTMVLCTSGVLPLYQGIALVLGENIGTTLTANLAALSSSVQARRAAFAHLFFNTFGVTWMLIVFYPFVDTLCSLLGVDPSSSELETDRLAYVLAAFHTSFNLLNTSALIWFVPQIERLCHFVIRDKSDEEEKPMRLQYIQRGPISTPEMALLQAQFETAHFGHRMQRMFEMVVQLENEDAEVERKKTFERIDKYEEIADSMESEIAQFLDQTGQEHLSDESKAHLRQMLAQIGELESIGDACLKMGHILMRRSEAGQPFTEEQQKGLLEIMKASGEALELMNRVLDEKFSGKDVIQLAKTEEHVNSLRMKMKNENIHAVNERHYGFAIGTLFIDLVCECERMVDYVVNVVEMRCGRLPNVDISE